MIKKLTVIETDCTNPYHNLALEEALLSQVSENEIILYLWQNRQTVVIGRNQCAPAECNIANLESDGGFLARRLSGGGAVYHDLGNLNFTFIARSSDFDKSAQTDVILRAVRSLGINAEKNGRNDLTVDGRKFSGHAYYKTKDRCYHHGTLMLYVDTEKLSRYLNVSPLKLKAKGVSSVKSRVINLCELKKDVNIDLLKEKLIASFAEVYNSPVSKLYEEEVDKALLTKLEKRYSDPDYKYGGIKILPCSLQQKFDWGQVRIDFALSDTEPRKLSDVLFYSDGLEADYLSQISERLINIELDTEKIYAALTDGIKLNEMQDIAQAASDIADLLGSSQWR